MQLNTPLELISFFSLCVRVPMCGIVVFIYSFCGFAEAAVVVILKMASVDVFNWAKLPPTQGSSKYS